MADKNLVASKADQHATGPHKAKMVTPTYTVVLMEGNIIHRTSGDK